jgi:hypothetical protein
MTAGTAGGDDDFGLDVLKPLKEGGAGVAAELVSIHIALDGGGEGGWLFEDLAEHPVSEGSGFGSYGHGRAFLTLN